MRHDKRRKIPSLLMLKKVVGFGLCLYLETGRLQTKSLTSAGLLAWPNIIAFPPRFERDSDFDD
jgi:hypothetical protein